MRSLILYYLVLLLSIIFSVSCSDDVRRIKGEGSNVANTRTPGSFSGISLAIDADVEVYRDSVFRVELIGQQNILNVISTGVSASVLHIGLSERSSIHSYNPVSIRVFMPSIEHMNISGSGDIQCVDDFALQQLSANISGSGNITCRGSISRSFQANISGSGSIFCHSRGKCPIAKYNISGSGNIHAEDLQADEAEAVISASGQQRIHVLGLLRGSISGSGDILYRGNPETRMALSGSGRLIRIQ